MTIELAVEASSLARRARTAARLAAGFKTCARCQQQLGLDQFSYCPSRRGDGRQSYCKACDSARVWERYQARTHPQLTDIAAACDGLAVTRRKSSNKGHTYPPFIPDLPRPPDFSRGTCTQVDSQHRLYWSSSVVAEREAARRMCQSCEILQACTTYALGITDSHVSDVIYAGMSASERRRRRKALLDQVAHEVRG